MYSFEEACRALLMDTREVLLMSTHNIRFHVEIRKIFLEQGRTIAFPTRLHVCPAMTLINLCIHAVWLESLQSTLWVAKEQKVSPVG